MNHAPVKTLGTFLAVAALLSVTAAASAAIVTWDAGGANTNWGTAGNWVDDPVWVNGNDVIFATNGTTATLDGNRTVGLMTFNKAGGFAIGSSSGNNILTVNTGITVSPAAPATYTISGLKLSGTLNVNVAAGSTINASWIDNAAAGKSLTKTGLGTLIVRGGFLGDLDVQAGTFRLEGYDGNSVVQANSMQFGAAAVSTYANCQLYLNGTINSHIESTFNIGVLRALGASTVLFDGSGSFSTPTYPVGLYLNNATIVLDNTVTNLADRLDNNTGIQLNGGRILLIGNNAAASTQHLSNNDYSQYSNTFGVPVLEIAHGTTANASMTVSRYQNNAFLAFSGTDLGSATSTYTAKVFGDTLPGITTGTTRAIPWAIVNGGMDFGAYTTVRGVYLMDGTVTRQGDINASVAASNVLINTDQLQMNADKSAATLKIDGAHALDLGTHTLTLGGMNGIYAVGGGIIQTGAANSIGGGSLVVPNGTGGGYLFVRNDQDLTLSFSSITASGMRFAGPGKTTVNVSGGVPANTYWSGGNLELNLAGTTKLLESTVTGSGTLIKGGAGTVDVSTATDFYNYTTGGVIVNGGTLVAANYSLGTGPVTVNAGATLYARDLLTGFQNSSITLNDGTLRFKAQANVSLDSNDTITIPSSKTGTIQVDNAALSLQGLAGAGTMVKTGVQTLNLTTVTGAGGFTGKFKVTDGTLAAAASNRIPAGVANFEVGNNGTMLLGTNAQTMTLTGKNFASNAGGLDSTSGILQLTGTSTVVLDGNTLKPGGAGVGFMKVNLNAGAALSLAGATASTYYVDIVGTGAVRGVDQDQLQFWNAATGTGVTLTGAQILLNLPDASESFDPAALQDKVIAIISGSYTGTFAGVGLAPGVSSNWSVDSGALQYTDGVYTTGVTVHQVTLQASALHWTPEPATLALLALGSLGLLRRRK